MSAANVFALICDRIVATYVFRPEIDPNEPGQRVPLEAARERLHNCRWSLFRVHCDGVCWPGDSLAGLEKPLRAPTGSREIK